MNNCFLLLSCLLFSFGCNLLKKIYDNQSYHNVANMLINAVLSGLSGFIFALILSEFFSNPMTIIGLSGFGGLLGMKTIDIIIKSKITEHLSADELLQHLVIFQDINHDDENTHIKIHVIRHR